MNRQLTESKEPDAHQGLREVPNPDAFGEASICADMQASVNSDHAAERDRTRFPRSIGTEVSEVIGKGERMGPVSGGKERILFVDDEEVLVAMAETMLHRLGYEVTGTTSSVEALLLFKEGPYRFDLVITDYTMPYMSGLALAKKMLTIRPDVPVMICTGFSENLSEEMSKKAGIRRFVLKPLIRREMAEAIRKVLDGTL